MDNTILICDEQYSPDARRVHQTLTRHSDDDFSLELFARRTARAITRHDAGLVKDGKPLASFLLVTRPSVPLLPIVETLAHTWLGDPWGGGRPLTYVNGNAFANALYPNALAPLVGPLPQDASAQPLFSQIETPHFSSRAYAALKTLFTWRKAFLEQYKKQSFFAKCTPQQRFAFYGEIDQLVSKAHERLYYDEEQKNPFSSVIFIDAVNRGSFELIELVRRMTQTGKVLIHPSSIIDLSRTILVFGVYDDGAILPKADIGFNGSAKANAQSTYERVRRGLFKHPATVGLVQDVGDNVFVIREMTKENQRARLTQRLKELFERFSDLDITLVFSEPFCEGLIEDMRENSLNCKNDEAPYTEPRFENCINRHVIDRLASIHAAGNLKGGLTVWFEAEAEKGTFSTSVRIKLQNGCPIDVKKLEGIFKKSPEPDIPYAELLKDGEIKKLDDAAVAIAKSWYDRVKAQLR
ncbi:MAG: hypothetical protein Q8Q39_00470 [bacterium]|nr:hypothetical protein [bacterium]